MFRPRSPASRAPASLVLCAASLVGCSPASDDTGDTAAAGGASGDGLVLVDANNYALESSLAIQSTPLAERSDATLDWSGLTTDLQGHDLDPVADIDVLTLLAFELTEAEVEAALATDTLSQSDMALYVSLDTEGRTSASLSELSLFGNDIDVEQYFEEGSGAWLLTVNTGTTPGVGARMVGFLAPSADAQADQAALTDDSAELFIDVDLLSLDPVAVSADTTQLDLDWSQLTVNAQGNTMVSGAADQVMLGRYDTLAAEDLQDAFLDLELLADQTWTVDIDGGSAASVTDFGTLDADATWVLALRCTTCSNPAPLFLTFLEVLP